MEYGITVQNERRVVDQEGYSGRVSWVRHERDDVEDGPLHIHGQE